MANESKTDCFAYNGKKGKWCTATLKKSCENCRFYKTKEQFEADEKRAARIYAQHLEEKGKAPLRFGESRDAGEKIQIGT